jgi:hypothetical protein
MYKENLVDINTDVRENYIPDNKTALQRVIESCYQQKICFQGDKFIHYIFIYRERSYNGLLTQYLTVSC